MKVGVKYLAGNVAFPLRKLRNGVVAMHAGLIIGSILQLLLGAYIYWLGTVYAFSAGVTNIWMGTVLVGVIMLAVGIFYKPIAVLKVSKWIFHIYCTALLLILVIVHTNLPTYTYMQAVEKVEKATGGQVVMDEGKEKTNHHASYYIYADKNVYLFNNETGDFAVYERDK